VSSEPAKGADSLLTAAALLLAPVPLLTRGATIRPELRISRSSPARQQGDKFHGFSRPRLGNIIYGTVQEPSSDQPLLCVALATSM